MKIKFLQIANVPLFVLLLFLTFSVENAYCSHIQGADISYTYIGSNQYRFVINLYRDCTSPTLLNSPLTITSTQTGSFGQCSQNVSSGTVAGLMTVVSGPTEVSQLCPAELSNSNCVGGSQPGTQKYVLERIVTLNFSCGTNTQWRVGFSFAARNTALTNLQNPGTTDLYIEAVIKQAASLGANSSPNFSVLPIPYVCINQPVVYSHGAVDAEGDSLRFTSINPLGANAAPALYVAPFTASNPLATSTGFTVNPVTGQLSYTPNQVQVATITLLVEEFRNGVLISSTMRDLQVIIRNCIANNPNSPTASSPANISGGTLVSNTMNVCAGSNFSFQFNATDLDAGNIINVTDNHLNSIPASTVTYSGSGNSVTGTFTWSPSLQDSGLNILAVTVSDNVCPISSVAAFSYNIFVVNCGCNTSVSVTNATNPTCNGRSNGSVSLTAGGGTAPYTYTWSNGRTGANVTGLAAGIFTITVSDANNCSVTRNVTLSEPSALTVSSSNQSTSCGSSIGTIDLTVSGATSPYTYSWSNNSTTQDISGLGAGSFTVTITDFNNCTSTFASTVSSSGLTVTPNPTSISCNGQSNGIAAVNVSGGTGAYTYLWSNSATTAAISALAVGVYQVTVNSGSSGSGTDTIYRQDFSAAHGWTLNVSTGVNGADNNFWTVNANEGGVLPPGCGVANNGNNTLHVTSVFFPSGGAAYDAGGLCGILFCPQTNRRAESPAFSTLGRTNITLSFNYISNGQGLTDNASVQYNDGTGWQILNNSIKSPVCGSGQGQWTAFSAVLPASCNNNANVRVGINWINNDDGVGTDPSVAIDNVLVTSPSTGGVACSGTQSVSITQPSAVTLTNSSVSAGCAQSNGSINLNVSGGTSPYTFLWSNGRTTEDITNLSSGSYTVTVSDFNNCTSTSSLSVSSIPCGCPNIALSPVAVSASCNSNNGSITLGVTGGQSPYTYSWSNGSTSQNISNISSGFYSVTVLDANSCSATNSIVVNSASATTVTLDSIINPICNGLNTGSIFISANSQPIPCSSASVVINEVMVRPDTTDGNSTNPLQTGEYIELIGPPGTNIGCFVLTDGDWSVTIPPGTVIPPDGIFTLGHNASPYAVRYGITYDLDVANCACFVAATAGSGILIFTNGGEYLALYNGSGTFIDGLLYGAPTAGNTPPSGALAAGGVINTIGTPGCVSSVTIPAAASYQTIATVVAVNTSYIRNPDGSGSWSTQVGGSPNACNITPVVTLNYSWTNGATTQDISGLNAGVYAVTVTDNAGCRSILAGTVTQPSAITATLSSTPFSCSGSSNITATVLSNGGTPQYTYNWSTGANTTTISNLITGSYSVTVTDANRCTVQNSVSVTQYNPMTVTVNSVSPQCAGVNSGSASALVSGGNASYTYSWSNGANSSSISNLSSGNYTVTVTDLNGCTLSGSATITSPSAISVTSNLGPISCNAANDGSVNLNVSGGTSAYNFNWSTGETTSTISNLGAGNYLVTVSDANSCTVQFAQTITNPAALSVNGQVNNIACSVLNIGTVSLSVNGGTGAYTYLWSNSATSSQITGLSAGNYSVTVSDANACSSTFSATVITTPGLQVTTQGTDVSCNGLSDGCVNVSVNGGNSPYTFAWSGGQTASSFCNLAPGTYIVTVSDAGAGGNLIDTLYEEDFQGVNNWTLNVSTGVNGADNNFWVVNDNEGGVLPPGCGLGNNGDLTMHITSVFNPNGGAAYDAGGLCGLLFCPETNRRAESPAFSTIGANNLTLKFDFISNGDALIDNASVWYNSGTGWTQLVNSIKSTVCGSGQGRWTNFTVPLPASCNNNPAVQIGFNWTNDDDGFGSDPSVAINNIVVFNSGTATTACTGTDTVTISQPSALTAITSNITNASCSGNGSVNITVNGGVSPYTFLWSNNQTTEDISGLTSGSYSVTVVDANGCSVVNASNTVNAGSQPAVNVVNTVNPSCNGSNNGTISIGLSGGTAPFTFQWSNGLATQNANTLSAGVYNLTATDASGCTATLLSAVTLTQPSSIVLNNISITNASCIDNDAAISYTVSGGTAGYNFLWSNGSNVQNLSNVSSGNYVLTVTDATGCNTVQNFTLSVTPAPAIVVGNQSVTDAVCSAANGSINFQVSGGTVPYFFNWTNGATTSQLNAVSSGSYTVTVSDALGCTTTVANFNVASINNISAVVTNVVNESCLSNQSGAVDISVTSGTANYVYQWSNGASTEDISALGQGSYAVTITDANFCQTVLSASVNQPLSPVLDAYVGTISVSDSTILFGESIDVNVGNDQSSQGVSYQWTVSPGSAALSNSNAVLTTVSPDSFGLYTLFVTATSADGCTDVDTVFINVLEPDNPQIPNAFSPNGDNINDNFSVVDLSKDYILEFKVFNRWGQIVYDNATEAIWDGKFNGELQPRDMYIFTIVWKRPNDPDKVIKRGSLMLLR